MSSHSCGTQTFGPGQPRISGLVRWPEPFPLTNGDDHDGIRSTHIRGWDAGDRLAGPLVSEGAAQSPSSSVLPSGGGAALLDTSDVVILLLDHQAGLFQTVKDIGVAELRANTTMLPKLATLLKIPVITTASEPNGPNGPVMPEIQEFAPHSVYVPRKGEVNAWDNEDFVNAVRATGKKTLIMAGVWTSVCVMFPALDAKAAGYKVYAVIDASGDPSELASRTAAPAMALPPSRCSSAGQGEPKCGAARFIRLRPQPAAMGIDDRPADR
jgi:nicotinamidase-related amidase